MKDKYQVIWTDLAESQLDLILQYISDNFGYDATLKLLDDVEHTNCLLATQPYIGFVEPSLVDCAKVYRCLVINKHDKVIYCVDDNTIEVVIFWDCRQNPQKMLRLIMEEEKHLDI